MAEGFKGLLDFAGYPVGVGAPPVVNGGFVGLLDFTGIPVGIGEFVPPEPPIIPPIPRDLGDGGALGWNKQSVKRRREREIEDDDLMILGKAAIEQIVKDFIKRNR